MIKITAGNLDRRISIQQKSVAREATYGGETITWVALATVWAQVLESATDGEFEQGGTLAYARPTRVRIRYRSDVDPTMRLAIGSRILQITGTAEIGRREYLELACKEWAHE